MASGRRTIGRFEIEREAASGGTGTVYRARDAETGQRVAVKVIRGLAENDAARFAREGRILSQIRHPGVVRYIEHGTHGLTDAYLAMEWLEGEDLRERLARAGVTMNESVTLGRRVAEALAAIHDHGLVHRDIKPGNLFLPRRSVDEVKIIDFGLARADEASIGLTQTGMVVGTPAYMAPEQARGRREIDARVDVYSLGCVLFKCLTGRAPFEGNHVMAVLTKVLLEEPPRLRELRRDVPAALDDLVARMLAKDPDERPAGAAAVAEALAAFGPIEELGDEAEPAPASMVFAGLMAGEQRMVTMLLVGADPREDAGDATVVEGRAAPPSSKARPPSSRRPSRSSSPPDVDSLVKEFGGQLDRLADGTRAITILGSAVATDQAAAAARCALSLRAVLPGVPMALATGRSEVARRPVGDAIDRAATMLGERARVAAAALGAARTPPTAIAVDDVTAALLDLRFEVSGEGEHLLHGLRELELGARTLLGKETAFVGREWEQSSVQALFDECADEPMARPVLVAAPAGMGKTRLGQEVVRAILERRPDVAVWTGRADPLRAGSALELLAQVLRSACGVQKGEPIEDRRRKVAERVALLVPPRDAPRVACFVGEIVGTPFEDEESFELRAARRDPRIMSEQMRRAWEELLAAACAAHPVLIVLEDLQWGDTSTVRFIDEALKVLAHRPWMVLSLARPEVLEVFPRLWDGRNLQEIRLKPLLRRASERLVREVLGDGVSAETAARLAATADGNAFYLEELIRAVAERRRRHEDSTSLPDTVLAMVQARLEGLDPDERRALRAASIFGEVFWPGGVAALLGGPIGPQLSPTWVEALVAREVLVRRAESRFAGEPELAFRHALLREGAYAMLTGRDRTMGHRLAGAWLERRGESDPVVLAQHFDLGQEAERAGVFYLQAAEQALRGADPDAAIARAERARASSLPPALGIECLGMLCEAHAWRNDWERCAVHAGELTRLATPASVPWLLGTAMQLSAAFSLGRPQEVMEALLTLMGVDPVPEAAGAISQALSVGVLVTCLAAQFELIPGILRHVDAQGAPIGERDPVVRGWMHLSHTYWEAWGSGDVWAAHVHARAARSSFAQARDARHALFAQPFVALTCWNLGMPEEAERELRSMVVSGDDHLVARIRALFLTLVLIERGALDEARELATRRIDVARARGETEDPSREAEGRWLLGEIALRAGDHEGAEREVAGALAPLRTAPLQWQFAATTLAAALLGLGRAAEAVILAREILDAIETQRGAGQRAGRIRLVYAESLHAVGDHAAAGAALAAAREDLLARAARIGDPEVRARFLGSIPENARTLALAEQRLGPVARPEG